MTSLPARNEQYGTKEYWFVHSFYSLFYLTRKTGIRDTPSKIHPFICVYLQNLAEAGKRTRSTGSSPTMICLDSFMN